MVAADYTGGQATAADTVDGVVAITPITPDQSFASVPYK